jgi:hypothetical protein
MTTRIAAALFAALAVAVSAAPADAQVGGNLAALPAVEIRLEITTGADGAPILSQKEFNLVTGDYYRMTLKSDGVAVWRVEAPDLLQNSHLRIVTIAGIEVQLQSLVFRAIEFDQGGEARFTFTPIKPGTYEVYVGKDPRSLGRPVGEAGIAPGPKTAIARIVVK